MAISSLFISCKRTNDKDLLKSTLPPQIIELYMQGDYEGIILLTDSLRNNGIQYTDYIAENRCDIAYCEALIAVGRANDAITELMGHINKVNPEDYYAYFALGIAWIYLDDTINAIAAYDRAIELRPTYARPYINLARIYRAIDKDKCMDNYAQAIWLFSANQFYDEVLDLGVEACTIDSTNAFILQCMIEARLEKD
ncbi:MAG: hypothetical protein K2O46_06295 [Bacteroidales bacterium]|nr:hypothetical protein [Bacteroidales bacterium]